MTAMNLTRRERRLMRRAAKPTTCHLCGAPATLRKTTPPWRKSTYCHATAVCDDHASYLDGHVWSKTGDGTWTDQGVPPTSCAWCPAPYGTCAHTARLAVEYELWVAQAITERLAPR